MNKFFVPSSGVSPDKIIIEDYNEAHHIRDVLRLKPGEKVAVFDENGNEYLCEVASLEDKVRLIIKTRVPAAKRDEKFKLTVACAIPKKAKIDDIIDKLVQLGVERIIPLKTERVIVKLDKHKEASRFERWKKIALNAAKQCKRNNLAILEPVLDFKNLIRESGEFDLKLIPHLEGARKSLKDILDKTASGGSVKVLILIGPEGDFSSGEVELAKASGFIPVTLGDLVLRVDTAAIAAVSFIKLYAYH